jgi:hypothetical protein
MKLYTAVGAFIVAVFVVVAVLSSGGNAQSNLDGTWKSSDLPMVAHISNNTIEIDVVDGGETDLYWKGTFDSTASDGTQTSFPDKTALSHSMLGSLANSKKFTLKDGELSYMFSILGHARTVYLKR